MGPAHVENVMNLACRAALSHSGVTHVAIPIDIPAMPAKAEKRFKRNVRGHTSTAYQPDRRTPEPHLITAAAEVLAGCKKIAILADAELEQVAERLGAPLIKALLGKDCVPDNSPYTTGGVEAVGPAPWSSRSRRATAF